MIEFKTFVGMDISKKTFDAALISTAASSITHQCFPQNKEGFTAFLQWLKRQHVALADTLICMERRALHRRYHSVSDRCQSTFMGRNGH